MRRAEPSVVVGRSALRTEDRLLARLGHREISALSQLSAPKRTFDLAVVTYRDFMSTPLARALDRLDVVHAATIPLRAEPAATRCGEMVE